MSATLISLNSDLVKLEAEGYRLRIVRGVANQLIVDGIPAVNIKGKVVFGSVYTPLEIDANGKVRAPLANHQCWWIGSDPPCDYTGKVMDELIANTGAEDKGDGIKTRVGMSRKLKSGGSTIPYPDDY